MRVWDRSSKFPTAMLCGLHKAYFTRGASTRPSVQNHVVGGGESCEARLLALACLLLG